MEPDERLPDPADVEAVPLADRAEAYLAVHDRLQQRLGLVGA